MKTRKIRYAVVGQGYISQIAVLPAFRHTKNSQLVALVSGDFKKLKELGKKYKVKNLYHYDQYEECLSSGKIDAVYIALPNDQHRKFTEIAAKYKIHVLCEKPMAVTVPDCEAMIHAASENDIKLMIAYRLHFEEANLKAIQIAQSGKLGDIRVFNSVFALPIKEDGIRVRPREEGGGPTYDIGIYCINAARYIFQDEPTEVISMAAKSDKEPFGDIEEAMSVILKFPNERTACFTCTYDAQGVGNYQILGTKGNLVVDNAYEFIGPKTHYLTIKDKRQIKKFKSRDQFAPEISYFSNCIIKDKKPEPSGEEGLADVRIIEAIFKSAETGQKVYLEPISKDQRPNLSQEETHPPVDEPDLINIEKPSAEEAA